MKKNSLNPFALLSKSRLEVVAKQRNKQLHCANECEQRLLECRAKLVGLDAEYKALGGLLLPDCTTWQKP